MYLLQGLLSTTEIREDDQREDTKAKKLQKRAIQSVDPGKAAEQMKKSLKYYEAEEKEILAIDNYYFLISLLMSANK
jgi:hypothetical protein